jgi:hypothetical protein
MINLNDPQKNQICFEKLIQTDIFYGNVYYYLAQFETEFNDLVYFILNLENANNLFETLLIHDWSETSTIKYIIENDAYFNLDKRLNPFELFVTKYCVGVFISNQFSISLEENNRLHSFCKILFLKLNNMNDIFKYKIITKDIDFNVTTNSIELEINSELVEETKVDKDEVLDNAISWKNEIRILAYIFWKMKQDKIFECENLGSILSKVFVDSKKNKIKNTLFNTEFSKFTNGTFPKKVSEIDKFVESIKI